MNKYKIILKECIICGKKFPVKIRKKDRKIMSKCFHSYMRKHMFLGWTYELITTSPELVTKPHFSNTFYKIVGFSKVSREIVYFIWKLFHKGKIEYWECEECCTSED